MLTNLKIRDFALIQDVEIDLEGGLTVLTGQTGSGKSIILEAINLLFGKRSDQDMIRHGKSMAVVSGEFLINEHLQRMFDLPSKINIVREIDINGKHKVYINGLTRTLTQLKSLTENIGSIHNQMDTIFLSKNEEYINLIDNLDKNKINLLLSDYLISRQDYFNHKKILEDTLQKKDLDSEQKEYLEYQIKELDSYNLVDNEKEDLEDRFNQLKNFDKITTSLNQIISNFVNLDEIYETSKLLESISSFDSDYNVLKEKSLTNYYELKEILDSIKHKYNSLDYNELEFNKIQERLYELNKLETKYKKNIPELINYLKLIKNRIDNIENYDENIRLLEVTLADKFDIAYSHATKLSNYREDLSNKLEELIVNELKDLDLVNTNFKVMNTKYNKKSKILLETGIDSLEFLISFNKGEPLKPLAKVASGGEIARFMFAIKCIYTKVSDLSILVLDEIDTGISGKVAAMMANKMKLISTDKQLIVISHLPQIAAKADIHYGISKEIVNNRMTTNIIKLEYNQRVEMIAMLLSGESMSNYAIEQAKLLLLK